MPLPNIPENPPLQYPGVHPASAANNSSSQQITSYASTVPTIAINGNSPNYFKMMPG
jgi:hypothetical protein